MSDQPALLNREARMRALLAAAFEPTELVIENDSARHASHAGMRESAHIAARGPGSTGAASPGESHFNVRIVSNVFTGLSRVERARRVHMVLADELASGLHALALQLHAPGEAGR